jgi:hypothetical protein
MLRLFLDMTSCVPGVGAAGSREKTGRRA